MAEAGRQSADGVSIRSAKIVVAPGCRMTEAKGPTADLSAECREPHSLKKSTRRGTLGERERRERREERGERRGERRRLWMQEVGGGVIKRYDFYDGGAVATVWRRRLNPSSARGAERSDDS